MLNNKNYNNIIPFVVTHFSFIYVNIFVNIFIQYTLYELLYVYTSKFWNGYFSSTYMYVSASYVYSSLKRFVVYAIKTV